MTFSLLIGRISTDRLCYSIPSALILLITALFPLAAATAAAPSLRITDIQRCGNRLSHPLATYCLHVKGLGKSPVTARLAGKQLPSSSLERQQGTLLELTLDQRNWRSGPLVIAQEETASNAVWLTLGGSHVVAATEREVVRNDDGLTTYLDLISVLIEEDEDGRREAHRIAAKYGATVVGGIPPLNVYQLRLPVNTLIERDALVLRIGSEHDVDAVIIEETDPEPPVEGMRDSERSSMDEWSSNQFQDALYIYRELVAAGHPTTPVRIGVVERDVDFDSSGFRDQLGDCRSKQRRTCTMARDAAKPDGHGTTVTAVIAAHGDELDRHSSGFLAALDGIGPGFEVIVDRNSDAGITANVAASVNLVQDGARLINWSWGLHRLGTTDVTGHEVDSLVRSGLAMSGYEELLEEFFRWLRAEHPEVIVINSAGNGSSFSSTDDYRIPSSLITDQLIVVGGHQRSADPTKEVSDPTYAVQRASSNIDRRVDITAAACVNAAPASPDMNSKIHCGTSYATPLVTATLAAMLSLNPELTPEQLRILLRRSSLPIGAGEDFEQVDAEDLSAPILPSERDNRLDHPDLGYSARLAMRRAIELAAASRNRTR